MEIGAFVDDELPDYIMVMVANKRTKAQMNDDLSLFLGSNTHHFTSWLHSVLEQLKQVTLISQGKQILQGTTLKKYMNTNLSKEIILIHRNDSCQLNQKKNSKQFTQCVPRKD